MLLEVTDTMEVEFRSSDLVSSHHNSSNINIGLLK